MARPPQEQSNYWQDVSAAYGYLLAQPQRIETVYSVSPFYSRRTSFSWIQQPDSRLPANAVEASQIKNRNFLGRTTVSHHLSMAFHLPGENVGLTNIDVNLNTQKIEAVTSQMVPAGEYAHDGRADDLFSRALNHDSLVTEATDEHYDMLRRHLVGGVAQKATFLLELIDNEDS